MSIGSGITSAVDDIVRAAMIDRKERESYEAAVGRINALSQMGVKGGQIVKIDPNIKDKDIVPFVNKKALDDIRNNKQLNRAQKQGEIKAYTDIGMANLRMQLQQAARDAANPKTQTTFDGQTYNLNDAQRLQAAQNAAAAKRAEASGARAERGTQLQEQAAAGTQPVQKRRFDQADAKEQRAILEKQPEYQFMNKHGIPPAKILENPFEDYTLYKSGSKGEKVPEAWNITRDPQGTLVGQGAGPTSRLRTSEYIPPDFVPGKTTPDDVKKFQKQFFYEANSPIYRVTKSPYSQTTEDGAAKTTVKGLQYTTNPEGDTMHVHGQYMPMNEYQSMLARANVMKQSYLNKITYDPNSGETLDAYNKRVAGLNQYMTQLGYDPQQFLK